MKKLVCLGLLTLSTVCLADGGMSGNDICQLIKDKSHTESIHYDELLSQRCDGLKGDDLKNCRAPWQAQENHYTDLYNKSYDICPGDEITKKGRKACLKYKKAYLKNNDYESYHWFDKMCPGS